MISRALVAILLMMNLGVAAWALWGPEPYPAQARDAALAGIPQLRLLAEAARVAAPLPAAADIGNSEPAASDAKAPESLAEVTSLPAPEPAVAVDEAAPTADVAGALAAAAPPAPLAADGEPPAPSAAYRCFSIGPFVAIDDVRRTSALLESALQRQQVREVRSSEVRGYRVYLPAFASRQQAMDAARGLQEKGLRDYYVVTAGEQENTVSLGLFRDLGNAQARREMVRGFGFEPRLEPREQELTRWWLDIAVAANDEAWRAQATRYPGTRIESLACE